jgi:uncharacterized protein YjbJ (UPF0337 family)
MNKDRVMGTIYDKAGCVGCNADELTGHTQLQLEGMAQQTKGKVVISWGNAKNAILKVNPQTTLQRNTNV